MADFNFSNKIVKQVGSFGVVGLTLTIGSLIVYYILLTVFELPLYPVYVCVYLVTVIFSYVLNAKYTFKKERNTKDLLKYGAIYIIGLMFGILLLKGIKYYTPVSNFIAVIFSIPPRILLTFLASKLIVFKN